MAPGVSGHPGLSAWLSVDLVKRSDTGFAIHHLTEEETARGKKLTVSIVILNKNV
jgi:hypothetical protein